MKSENDQEMSLSQTSDQAWHSEDETQSATTKKNILKE